ncbi:MAG: aminotransferase class IV [Candidatus Promineifilaceae bacterium]|nr:aminotransferase class IV [Candidatus Promineifilaceae bacterium]
MAENQLFAVTDQGAVCLGSFAAETSFVAMLDGYPLGAYSALRTFNHNKFLDLEAHLARTLNSMAIMGKDYNFDEAWFRRALHQAVSNYPLPNSRLRFDILSEAVQRQGFVTQELICLRPFKPTPPRFYKEGVGVDFERSMQRHRPLAKTADFAQQREPLALGYKQDHFERLILDDDGHVLEGMMSNFWAIKAGTVYTAAEGVLEGVTRKILLSIIPELDITLVMEAIRAEEIGTLDEAAMSGSSRALLPVVRINGQKVGDGAPGPLCRRILRAYEDYVARAVRTAV